jgi:hypothetical protein
VIQNVSGQIRRGSVAMTSIRPSGSRRPQEPPYAIFRMRIDAGPA